MQIIGNLLNEDDQNMRANSSLFFLFFVIKTYSFMKRELIIKELNKMEYDVNFYLEVLKQQIWMEGFYVGVMVMGVIALIILCISMYVNR